MFAIDGYMFSYMWMRHCDEADHSTRPLNQTTSCCSLLAANPEKLPRSIHPQLLWDQILGLHYFYLTLTIHRAIFCWDLRFPEFLLLDSGSKLAVREGIPNAHWRLYLFFPKYKGLPASLWSLMIIPSTIKSIWTSAQLLTGMEWNVEDLPPCGEHGDRKLRALYSGTIRDGRVFASIVAPVEGLCRWHCRDSILCPEGLVSTNETWLFSCLCVHPEEPQRWLVNRK